MLNVSQTAKPYRKVIYHQCPGSLITLLHLLTVLSSNGALLEDTYPRHPSKRRVTLCSLCIPRVVTVSFAFRGVCAQIPVRLPAP